MNGYKSQVATELIPIEELKLAAGIIASASEAPQVATELIPIEELKLCRCARASSSNFDVATELIPIEELKRTSKPTIEETGFMLQPN